MILSTLLFAAAVAAPPPIAYVDANLVTGANDGSSWANAFRGPLGLQAALATDAPTIWVADGTYYPGPVGSPESTTFLLGGSRTIVAGFAGGETHVSMADPVAHPAVVTGDLPGGPAGQPELATIMTVIGGTTALIVDGLTFDVSVSGPTQSVGNGRRAIAVDQSPGANFYRCAIRDGRAPIGAGMRITQSSVALYQCTIEGNTADVAGGGVHSDAVSEVYIGECVVRKNVGGRGAGIYFGAEPGQAAGGSFPSIGKTTFSENLGLIGAASGGGVCCRAIVAEFIDCTFDRCIVSGGGGGLFSENSNLTLDNCRFIDCAAAGDGGGAIYANNTSPSNQQTTDLSDCLFTGNHNALFAANGASIVAEHCTIANGRPQPGQPVIFPAIVATGGQPSDITLRNSIVWGNATVIGAPVGGNALALGGSTVLFERCDAQGWAGPVGSIGGTQTFAADPAFLDSDGADGVAGTADDDLRLRLVSPCIDAWDEGVIDLEYYLAYDIANVERPYDMPTVADTGMGTDPYGDLGCFERSPSDCPADLTLDGMVDAADIGSLLGEWNSRRSVADLNHDQFVDANDLAILLGAFGTPCI
jgi:hypothetical protein